MVDNEANSVAAHSEHAWNTHSYLNNYIQFADAKAGVLLGLSGAGMVTILKSTAFISKKSDLNTGHVALAFFAGCFFCCIFVVVPRLFTWKSMRRSFLRFLPRFPCDKVGTAVAKENAKYRSTVFWQGILEHQEPSMFLAALKGLDDKHLLREVAFHNFELSAILVRKYRWLKFAFWLFATAGFFMAFFYGFHNLNINAPTN